MTLLAPIYMIIAGAVALGVVGLHFLSTQLARSEILPTVRFVPEVPAQATSITVRFSDLLLLVLRVLAVLLIGLALSRPQLTPSKRPIVRVVAIDGSRAAASGREVTDSARAYVAGAAAVILFDSTARDITVGARDSLTRLAGTATLARAGRGALSSALVLALRAATRLRDNADSFQLVIVSPLVAEERDAATDSIRALWPGRIDLVHVGAATSASQAVARAKMEWPDSGASTAWIARTPVDTIGAVRAGSTVVVFPFVRRWKAAPRASKTRIVARWSDGEPAILERATDAGCVRSVAVSIPAVGDVMLRPDVERFLAGLSAPCGETPDFTLLSESWVSGFATSGRLAPASAVARRLVKVTPLVPWLLSAALLLLLGELVLRRRMRTAEMQSVGDDASRVVRSAA